MEPAATANAIMEHPFADSGDFDAVVRLYWIARRQIRQTLPRWILASAALSLMVAAPVYWSARQQRDAEQAKADQLLLERVHAGLSRTVPASMEPLMQLIAPENAK